MYARNDEQRKTTIVAQPRCGFVDVERLGKKRSLAYNLPKRKGFENDTHSFPLDGAAHFKRARAVHDLHRSESDQQNANHL